MKAGWVVLAAVTLAGAAHAQDLGEVAQRIEGPGVVFTRALNKAETYLSHEGDVLRLSSPPKSDSFRDPDGKVSVNTAPTLLLDVDNSAPFTFSGKLTPSFAATYDAGAFYVWVREDLWLKFALERDERGKTRIVTVRTNNTSDDNNHDVVTAPSVYLKISSDTKTIGFYYSVDNETWQLVRLFKNDYPPKIAVGVSAQSPTGEGNVVRLQGLSFAPRAVADFRMGK